ncbi:single-stranded DNA-binding protein [Macrococcoides caseolyticum]|uniref:single-stranded DNA-binding protein n=1 Tax=Macrococcoides caseolyticum TaxID=69966 RepID=UPI000C3496E1|nr:single-stranded DNA-binding protein [Macrococcus caseolyticus]PKE17791.1 single-stranded DNA-binding protein [Macrococcus caseolyticus]PKE67395.1 single-stranded DNA-binding protein [Macrococcus caseolyticus]
MINRVVLVGRLTKDPEYRVTQSGVAVASFTLAVNRTFTNANGERQADFINCIVFRKQADNVNTYLHKGSLAGVDGRLQSRSYENQEGRRVFVTEVVCESVQFLEPKNSRNGADHYEDYPQAQKTNDYAEREKKAQETMPGNNPFANADGPIDISDDDLPF